MASNQTEHYGLNLWEAGDDFLRTEFNEDNRKIDAAIPSIKVGYYEGSQKASVDIWREVSLGYRPKMVLAVMNGGANSGYLDGCAAQLVTIEQPTADCLRLTDAGFEVKGRLNETSAKFNPYRYLVIC